jgi:hypothetical protein
MKKVLLIILIALSSCTKYNYPDDVYYSEPVYPMYEYPEYQDRWPLFNYFLPTYPQYYGPYYYLPHYRINPPVYFEPRYRKEQNSNVKPTKPSVPIRKFEKPN